jgi:hypothetical protein
VFADIPRIFQESPKRLGSRRSVRAPWSNSRTVEGQLFGSDISGAGDVGQQDARAPADALGAADRTVRTSAGGPTPRTLGDRPELLIVSRRLVVRIEALRQEGVDAWMVFSLSFGLISVLSAYGRRDITVVLRQRP